MNKIRKAAAGIVAGAAIASAPLVAFAAPAFAAIGPGGSGGPHNAPEQHVLVDNASSGQSNASNVSGSSTRSNIYTNSHNFSNEYFGALSQLNNSAHCGGGINC